MHKHLKESNSFIKWHRELMIINKRAKSEARLNKIKFFFNRYFGTRFNLDFTYQNKRDQVKTVKILGVKRPVVKNYSEGIEV
jgi:hypothetical protein